MAKYCESVQNTPNCGTKSEIEKSPTIFTCKYALKPYFLPLQEKDKSLNSFEIQGLALFCLFLKWYHQESNDSQTAHYINILQDSKALVPRVFIAENALFHRHLPEGLISVSNIRKIYLKKV